MQSAIKAKKMFNKVLMMQKYIAFFSLKMSACTRHWLPLDCHQFARALVLSGYEKELILSQHSNTLILQHQVYQNILSNRSGAILTRTTLQNDQLADCYYKNQPYLPQHRQRAHPSLVKSIQRYRQQDFSLFLKSPQLVYRL